MKKATIIFLMLFPAIMLGQTVIDLDKTYIDSIWTTITVGDSLILTNLASDNLVVFNPTSTGKVDTTETSDISEITIDTLTFDYGDVTNNLDIGGFVKRSVTSGITAVNPGGQGDGSLTTDINEVSTVGAEDDAITLPSAIAGLEIFIINNGANILEIWPASGDNLGAGVDTATTLVAGANITFVSYDATNWETK